MGQHVSGAGNRQSVNSPYEGCSLDNNISWRVRDIPERLRPREEVERRGIKNVSDEVLLAIILRSGTRHKSVVELASHLLRHYGSLTALAAASADEIRQFRGMGSVKTQVLQATLELARRLGGERTAGSYRIRTPEDVASLLRDETRALECEIFWVIHVDAKNCIKGRPVEVTRGLLDASLVHPREVFREAIRSATSAVVLAHNHPSGDPAPSGEDIRITKQLVEAGRIVDIKVMDHVILGRESVQGAKWFMSLREEGLIKFDH